MATYTRRTFQNMAAACSGCGDAKQILRHAHANTKARGPNCLDHRITTSEHSLQLPKRPFSWRRRTWRAPSWHFTMMESSTHLNKFATSGWIYDNGAWITMSLNVAQMSVSECTCSLTCLLEFLWWPVGPCPWIGVVPPPWAWYLKNELDAQLPNDSCHKRRGLCMKSDQAQNWWRIYIYIYIYVCVCVCICIYIYKQTHAKLNCHLTTIFLMFWNIISAWTLWILSLPPSLEHILLVKCRQYAFCTRNVSSQLAIFFW